MSREARKARKAEELPQGEAKVKAVREMFDTIAPRYDLVNRVMTFRMDVGWRRKTVRALESAPGARVLDLASGTGDLCSDLVKAGASPIAVDFSFGMLAHSTHEAPRVQGDALALPLADSSVDGVTCGFALRNFLALPPVFAELARVVRPGGRIALLEVSEPKNRLLRFGDRFYFRHVVPKIGAALSDGAAYRYLPKSVAYLPETGVLLAQLRNAGFGAIERRLLTTGITQLITATREVR